MAETLSGALTLDLLWLGLGGLSPDLDPAWPHDLRYLTHQVDGQQAIRQIGVADLDVVSELEPLLERTRPDATVQELPLRTGRLLAMLAWFKSG